MSPRRRSHSWIHGQVTMFRRLSHKRQVVLIALITTLVLFVIAVFTTVYFATTLASKERIMNRNKTGLTLLDRNGQVFYEFYNAHTNTRVALDHIAPLAQKAAIASEDKDFYKHAGFSPKGIADAIYQNVRPGGIDNGGSTITQQLVKNALLSQDRNFLRKYQELILSVEIERRYSKDEILEMYLNSVYFGEGSFGIEDAAKTYFGTSAKDLDVAEASLLIGLLPAPSAYSPISGNADLAKKRQAYVLTRMQQDGVINQAEADAARAEPLHYQPKPPEPKPKAPHFALMVEQDLEQRYGEEKIARSGYKVKTTIDLGKQQKAEDALNKQLDRLAGSKVSNGSVVAIDPKTGEINALVGSRDWQNTQFGKVNMATTPRQPGSSIKPLVYGTAIEEEKLTAATILHDKLTDFGGGYTPKDADLRYRGDVTARRALANSLNIPAVETLQKVGVQNALDTAKKMGITTLTDSPESYGLTLALGSGAVRLTELTNAYATFANQGERHDIQTILSITDKDGQEIFKATPKITNAISPETSYIISSMLSDNSARAEIFGSSLTLSGGRTAAVKTGTTEDYRDALTLGYTPSLTIGVWIGNNDNTPMNSIAGSLGAAPIWRQLMQDYLAGTKIESFVKPSGVIAATLCRGQFAVAENPGNNTYTEYFLAGTLPSERCNTQKAEPKPAPSEPPEPDTKPSDNQTKPLDDTKQPATKTTTPDTSGTDNSAGDNNGGSTSPQTPTTPPVSPTVP